ncbi:MAG: DUF6515 family protein [Steroidobacteraceae bacterium]
MRFLVLSVSALCATCFGSTYVLAQTGQWGQAEDRTPPYSTHVDRRHGNDRVYPDRGAVVRDLPQGAAGVNYAGVSYRFAGGVWYERLGPAYIVVAPPIGVIVPQLPAFASGFDQGGTSYLYANDVFYRARPDLGGYEVVNDPQDQVSEHSQAPAAPASTRVASAIAVMTPAVAVAPSVAAAPPPVAAPPVAAAPAVAAAPPVAAAPSPSQVPVQPPVAAETNSTGSSSTPAGNPTAVAIQPHNGQSADQEASDRYECYRFAVAQSGFDPLAANGGSAPSDVARHEYSRAQAACLEGRGYSIP